MALYRLATGVYPRTHGETCQREIHRPVYPRNTFTIWVYPRTHGETHVQGYRYRHAGWVYPRTHGETSLCAYEKRGVFGKPAFCLLTGVYPRTHGETLIYQSLEYHDLAKKGLSPYTRGNLAAIPVHGEYRQYFNKVYPRTHGETRHSIRRYGVQYTRGNSPMGLSPYTRGNPEVYRSLRRLSPYTRGKLIKRATHLKVRWGLSPYTRGNLSAKRAQALASYTRGKPRVYPRTHGETCTNVYFFLPRK